jgi:hypothetical protein
MYGSHVLSGNNFWTKATPFIPSKLALHATPEYWSFIINYSYICI